MLFTTLPNWFSITAIFCTDVFNMKEEALYSYVSEVEVLVDHIGTINSTRIPILKKS